MTDHPGIDDAPTEQWQHAGLTARAVRRAVGFRKRRTELHVELESDDLRVGFVGRELAAFFDGNTDTLESGDDDRLSYLYCVSEALPPAGAAALSGMPIGSVVLLAASPGVLTSVATVPPDAAADLARWFRALS